MVLHFEEGGSFKAWLKGLKRAPRQTELDKILTPLLDALEMVHAGDFLHRDIAPDNIIIRKDGSPVLIDFGSARGEIASHSKTVSALVKPGYSPYEQYATTSRQQGPWTDIYALGATLYHAVTGKRPPDAPSRMVNDEYVPARAVALSSYRPGFLAAIDKALQARGRRAPAIDRAMARAAAGAGAQARAGRLGLGRALDRLRTGDPARSRRAAEAARRQHRAALTEARSEPRAGTARRSAAQGPAARLHRRAEEAPLGTRRQEGDAAADARPAPAAARDAGRPPPPAIRPGLRAVARRRPWQGSRSHRGARRSGQRPRPVPAVLARRRRRARAASAACASRRGAGARCSTGWRSGSALPASPSPIRTSCRIWRGAAPAWCRARPPTCRPPPASPATQAPSPASPPPTRDAGSCRPAPTARCRVWNAGSGALGAHHRARRRPGHRHCRRRSPRAHRPQERRHRAVGPGARRQARRVPAPQSPISALAFTGDADHFAAASQVGAVALFDVRAPSAPAAVVRGPGWRPGDRRLALFAGCWRPAGAGPQHQAVAHGYAQPRAQLARPGRCVERARHGAGRAQHRQRQHRPARCGCGPPRPRARSAPSRRTRAASPRSHSRPTTACWPRPARTAR